MSYDFGFVIEWDYFVRGDFIEYGVFDLYLVILHGSIS